MKPAAFALLFLVAGCSSSFTRASPTVRAAFDRCRASMRPVPCMGEDASSFVCNNREGAAARECAALPASRQTAWLVGHGCHEQVATYR